MNTNSKRHIDNICPGCAALYGAEPSGNCYTAHEAPCDNCGTVAYLGSVDDWDWPDGKPMKWRGTGRD
jgi:hypothetical protein